MARTWLLSLLLLRAASGAKVAKQGSCFLEQDDAFDDPQPGLALLQLRLNSDASTVATTPPRRRELLKQRCSESCVPAVFVVSSGRAGSTSIMHMLNLIPGYDIKGENLRMWGSIYKMYAELDSNYRNFESSKLYAWRRSAERNRTEMLCGLRTMVLAELSPSAGARVVGFKEHRWSFDQDLKDLETLMEVFPCAKVVLNYREDLEQQLISQSRAFGDFDYHITDAANKALHKFASRHASRSFVLPLEQFSVERFNELLHFLGEDGHCRYITVVHDNDGLDFTQTPDPLLREAINCTSSP
eukprot:gb/GFBE01069663.1/.p1 GENE.gb/GFBE01069663.1/~~gb/GFBE01069663.1/.p1  ORF type:complete len:300 (+),score=53.60 gb/GFBE01069663.1/:1-900(+)